MLYSAFLKHGYDVQEMHFGEKEYTKFTHPNGKVWFTSAISISYPVLNAAVTMLARQKDLSSQFAASIGVSVPQTVYTSNAESAQLLLEATKKVIVKPVDASASRGLTLNIESMSELEEAILTAQQASDKPVLVQEQVTGDELRFVVLDGKIEAAILRQTPRVVGDGQSSIAELIKQENVSRANIKITHATYPSLDQFITSDVQNDQTVLGVGEVLELGKGTMIRSGASIYDVTPNVHESYVDVVTHLAHELGASFLIVDLIIADYKKPLTDTNYWFLEFNTAPALRLFYACRDGNHFDIMPHLIKMVDSALSQK